MTYTYSIKLFRSLKCYPYWTFNFNDSCFFYIMISINVREELIEKLPFECTICNKTFFCSKSNCDDHIKTMHSK